MTTSYLPVNNTAADVTVTVPHVVSGHNTQSFQFLKLMLLNARSLKNKLCDVDVLLPTDQTDIVRITET